MQEQKEEEATVTRAVKPTPAFEEHVILPSGLHEDAQLNLISVPLAEVDKAYGQNEVIFFFCYNFGWFKLFVYSCIYLVIAYVRVGYVGY